MPDEFYKPRFSDLTNIRTLDGSTSSNQISSIVIISDALTRILIPLVRGLLPLEFTPGIISLLAGKPAPECFPVMSLSLSIRSPLSTPENPLSHIPISLNESELEDALQYGQTRGLNSYLGWVTGLQEHFHGRVAATEGWSVAAGSGSQDLLYKVCRESCLPNSANRNWNIPVGFSCPAQPRGWHLR